jgi:hypothetical protein
MPPLSMWPGLLPLARHYSSRKCNKINSPSFKINITSLDKDCCLIVDSFEKNYREQKTRSRFAKSAAGGREPKEDGRRRYFGRSIAVFRLQEL